MSLSVDFSAPISNLAARLA